MPQIKMLYGLNEKAVWGNYMISKLNKVHVLIDKLYVQ